MGTELVGLRPSNGLFCEYGISWSGSWTIGVFDALLGGVLKGLSMSKSGLIIRKNERYEISLPARARVAFSHAELVKFSKGACDSEGWVDVQLIDFSKAGIGLVTTKFFPRGSMIEVEVPEIGEDSSSVMIQCEMRVMRVQMMDRRPAYLIGGAFTTIDDDLEEQIEGILNRLEGIGGDDA